ncbi:MAG: molybdopterin molybdotransferase MoeA, partial [Phyllobacteriaceae bacterium]|nr:molybdopterin molybdotransferase MoeA [Phyllobacteriaceae bacterium]
AFAFGGELMRIEEALAHVAAHVPPVAETERVTISQADGRVLAAAMRAPMALPAFDNSAVDGYAVAFDALAADGASVLPIVGRIAAGHGAGHAATAGAAVRIFTGAPMPVGCDTVFMQEDTTLLDDGRVSLPKGLKRGANTRPRGEDVEEGAEVLAAGRRLDPRDVALLAALGVAEIEVRRRPRVAVFSTGDEILEPGVPLAPAHLYDSNRFALMAMLRRAGCEVTDLGILADDVVETADRLDRAARDHDLVVTSGGVSTGEEDHVKAALARKGALQFWRLAIKPGRPVVMGSLEGAAFVGLPGNPVAVFVTFAHVLRPIVAALAGAAVLPLPRQEVIAGFAHRKKAGRREYVRVSLKIEGGHVIAEKYPIDGAGVLTSLTRTDGLVELAEETTEVAPGTTVPFLDYRLML